MSASPDRTASLRGTEGELVSVRIVVEPRRVEKLLDLLAGLNFPINPQLYHEPSLVRVEPDGAHRMEPATAVEFPAWAGRVQEIERALAGSGFDRACLSLSDMLVAIHAGNDAAAA